jgi:hypothetical protein
VTLLCLVFDVSDRDGNTASSLFWRLIDLIECAYLIEVWVFVVKHLGNRSSKSGLTVVDVTNGANVCVRLCPLELCLCHCGFSFFISSLLFP